MSTQRIMDSEFGLTREFDPPTALQVALQRHRAKLLPLGGVLVLLVVVCAMIGLVAHDRKQYTTLSDRLREAEAFHSTYLTRVRGETPASQRQFSSESLALPNDHQKVGWSEWYFVGVTIVLSSVIAPHACK